VFVREVFFWAEIDEVLLGMFESQCPPVTHMVASAPHFAHFSCAMLGDPPEQLDNSYKHRKTRRQIATLSVNSIAPPSIVEKVERAECPSSIARQRHRT
jgi:hypothetical protein